MTEYKTDYLGDAFVYDDYNQNPELIQEDKSGYRVFLTRDRDLISEFADMRAKAYKDEFANGDVVTFKKMQEVFDRNGKILIVTKNGELIGGMRLMFSDECKYMSNEYPGTQFEYKQVLKRYGETIGLGIVEVASVVVKEDERDFAAVEAMFEKVLKVAMLRPCSYIFGTTLISACRLYRRIFDKLDCYLEVVLSHPWERKETFGFAKMFPIYVKINN